MSWIHLVWLFLVLPSFWVYSSGDATGILIFGNIGKVLSLFIAGLSLSFTQNGYSAKDTPYKAWSALACGMWVWFFGQIIFADYKLVLNASPYPSLADLFFALGYAPMIFGVAFLIKDFMSTGLPMGSRKSYIAQGTILAAIYAVIFLVLLKPMLATNDPFATKFLNVGYPTFDFILISLTTVLIRVSWVLRGGSLARSWIFLGAGFGLVCIGDIIFATHPYQFLDTVFFSGYFFIALAGVYQLRMLRQ